MVNTLSATLDTAQDSLLRNPIVELRSVQTADPIPFYGQPFNYLTDDEASPVMLAHSSGILIALWFRNDSIQLHYSDADHINWTETTVQYAGDDYDIVSLDTTELVNGYIGITYVKRNIYTRSEYIQRLVCTVNGAIVTAEATIASYDDDYDIIGISVEKLANSSYLIAYSRRNTTDYGLYTRSSSDFSSWGSETEVSTGFTATYAHYETRLFQADKDNDLFLFVAYANEVRDAKTEKVNIYYLLSTDYGASWGAAVKVTDADNWGQGFFQPSAANDSLEAFRMAYTAKTSLLYMTRDTDLWQQECTNYAIGARVFYDEARGYLYSVNRYTYIGTKKLCSVVVIDPVHWVVHRTYTTTTTPAYPSYLADESVGYPKIQSDGKYISVGSTFQCSVIDDDNETIVTYNFDPDSGSNVLGVDFRTAVGDFEIGPLRLDEANNRLYIAHVNNLTVNNRILIGYMDLTEAPSGGYYTWHEVAWVTNWTNNQIYELASRGDMLVFPDDNKLIISNNTSVDSWKGRTDVFALDTGALIKEYSYNTDIGYPYQGIQFMQVYGDFLYGFFSYNSGYGQENYRGMVRIDLQTHAISYLQPDYASRNDYGLRYKVVTEDGLIIIAATTDGVVTYDIDTGTWTRYNPTDYPDLFLGKTEAFDLSVAYNEATQTIYAGCPGDPTVDAFAGIRAFSLGGLFNQIKYRDVEKSGSWIFGAENLLVAGSFDQDPYGAYLSDDTYWLAWQHYDSISQEQSIYYDNTIAELDLTPYLTEDTLTVSKSIKSPGKLSFSVKTGHLFDPNNASSSLIRFLKKGRALTLRFGERISGSDYWSSQGTFYVDTFKMSYQRGKYPSAKISCVDRLSLLKLTKSIASAHFDYQYPEAVLESLLLSYTNLSAAEIDIPSFSNRHPIYYQVIDEKLLDAVEEILDHFGVFFYATADNKVQTRPVRFVGTPDNTYADNTKIIGFTPDDNFSDYTNRVTVMGESLNPVEVLYDEELLATYSGTGGWWETGAETRDIYYSSDKKRKARNARLVVLKSIKDFEILWQESEGQEYLEGEDPNGFYCTLVIEFPGLMAVLIGLIAAIVALGAAAIWCDFGQYCGGMILGFSLLISGVSYLLGQVATYDYEIHGRPFGEEKIQYQATANDTELQNFIDGLIIEQTIDDPFCYTQAECARVAAYELNVLKSQRKRLAFSKVTHLQDEPGDILRLVHPYSGAIVDVFVTDLTRSYKRGTVRKKDGYFIDKINGWRL